jgi:molybdopterin molybdotransferase
MEALRLIGKHARPVAATPRKLKNCANGVLAKPVRAGVDLPPFNQSSVDGYAVRHADLMVFKQFRIAGETPAGKVFRKELQPGETVRVYTGAAVPEGADTIVMQENTLPAEAGFISISNLPLKGSNLRQKGAQVKKGDLAIAAGTFLNPGVTGFLAALGITSVSTRIPLVSLIVTGNELTEPGARLRAGKVYECNTVMLESALATTGVSVQRTVKVPDDLHVTAKAIGRACKHSHVVIVTGGVSVGDYDFTPAAMKEAGVKMIFHSVKQKPGKPLFFGIRGKTLLFGLPGNPAAVLTCFYEYVYPAINLLMGKNSPALKKIELPINRDIQGINGLSLFLKASINNSKAMIADGQESYYLAPFTQCDALVFVPGEKKQVRAGELVEAHLLPWTQ